MRRNSHRASRAFTSSALASLLVAAAPSAAAPAADYYLKLGAVQGERSATAPSGEIEINAWSWGATNSGAMSGGTGQGAGKMQAGGGKAQGVMGATAAAGDDDADGRKRVDKATPLIARAPASGRLTLRGALPACAVGTRYADAVVGDGSSRVELKDVVISSCAADGWSLNYASRRALP